MKTPVRGKATDDSAKLRRTVGGSLVCLLAIAAAFSTSCRPSTIVDRVEQIPFNTYEWKTTRRLDKRLEMVEDLRRSHLKAGMTRKDVIRLLGPPKKEIRSDEMAGVLVEGGACLHYHMGWSHGMVDGCYLIVVVDKNGDYAKSLVYEGY